MTTLRVPVGRLDHNPLKSLVTGLSLLGNCYLENKVHKIFRSCLALYGTTVGTMVLILTSNLAVISSIHSFNSQMQ